MKRRKFLSTGPSGALTGVVAGCLGTSAHRAEEATPDVISFGIVTDVHYADIPPRKSRPCHLSLAKLQEALARFNTRKLAFIIELGDFIDADPEKRRDLDYLQAARGVFETFPGPRYYVLGNHCVWVLGKEAFLTGCGLERSWYSFDSGPVHGVVLDACFTRNEAPYQPGEFDWKDSWIPQVQLNWLANDLAGAKGRTVLVFVHQNLQNESLAVGIKNAPEVRRVLEEAGNVFAVFQGHEHAGAYARISGIHYITMRGLIEGAELDSNSYGIATISGPDRMRIEGFNKQPNLILE